MSQDIKTELAEIRQRSRKLQARVLDYYVKPQYYSDLEKLLVMFAEVDVLYTKLQVKLRQYIQGNEN